MASFLICDQFLFDLYFTTSAPPVFLLQEYLFSPKMLSQWTFFAIYDPSRCCGKEEKAKDNILYFWPESTPENTQCNFVGLCIAVSALANRFSCGTAECVVTDVGVTAMVNIRDDLWVAGTVSHQTVASGTLKAAKPTLRPSSVFPHLLSTHPFQYVSNEHLTGAFNDNVATLLQTLIQQAFRTFEFRFRHGFLSTPTLRGFFNRFCSITAPFFPSHENDSSKRPTYNLESVALYGGGLSPITGDLMNFSLGFAPSHASLPQAGYHALRSTMQLWAPDCNSFCLFLGSQLVISTVCREQTHASMLLLMLFGSELSSFLPGFFFADNLHPLDSRPSHLCHVVHCTGQYHLFAFCGADQEQRITRAAAEIFQLCDRMLRSDGMQAAGGGVAGVAPSPSTFFSSYVGSSILLRAPTSAHGVSVSVPRLPCIYISLENGSRSSWTNISDTDSKKIRHGMVPVLCRAVKAANEFPCKASVKNQPLPIPIFHSPVGLSFNGDAEPHQQVTSGEDSLSTVFLSEASSPTGSVSHLARSSQDLSIYPTEDLGTAPFPINTMWLRRCGKPDELGSFEWWWQVAKDTWMVVRHANSRTVGFAFFDVASWNDIGDEVDRVTSLLFNNACTFIDAKNSNTS